MNPLQRLLIFSGVFVVGLFTMFVVAGLGNIVVRSGWWTVPAVVAGWVTIAYAMRRVERRWWGRV